MNHLFVKMTILFATSLSGFAWAQSLSPDNFEKTPQLYDESVVRAPIKEQNEVSLTATACRSRPHGLWDVCYNYSPNDRSLERVMSLSFTNFGENKIVEYSGYAVGRHFSFQFRDFARSDLNLLLSDSPSEDESKAHYAMYMFFPREVVPALKFENDVIELTLPTNEKVYIDYKTKEIISGVLTELPMRLDAKGAAVRPQLIYTGKGYMLEASRLHDYPVGDTFNMETGISGIAKNKATLSNAAGKKCDLAVKDLWKTNYNKGGAVFFNYAADLDFQKFVTSKCKF